MANIQFTVNRHGIGETSSAGYSGYRKDNIAKGKCPFCLNLAAFSQVGEGRNSALFGDMVAVECDGCNSIFSASIDQERIFPAPEIGGLNDLTGDIEEYYEEAIRCIESEAPNGAVAVLRKIIEAVCTEYEVTDVDSDDSIYDMIQELSNEGHITEELRKSLLTVKDAGNDAVHLNDNDPSLDQAKNLKRIVESVLTATIIARNRAEIAREDHPNPYTES